MKPLSLLLVIFIFSWQNTATAQDTTRIHIGDKTIIIVGEDVKSEDLDINAMLDSLSESDTITIETEEEMVKIQEKIHRKGDRNIGHWSGIEFGLGSFISAASNPDNYFNYNELTPNHTRSFVWNLNMFEQKLPLFKGHLGIISGLGFTFNNYHFNSGLNLSPKGDSTLVSFNDDRNYRTNKLQACYIKIPLLLEVNSSLLERKSAHLSVGAEAGLRLYSRTRQRYIENNRSYVSRNWDDYNLNPFRLNATARLGYKKFTLFANYGLTALFTKNSGVEEVYPVEVGIRLIDF